MRGNKTNVAATYTVSLAVLGNRLIFINLRLRIITRLSLLLGAPLLETKAATDQKSHEIKNFDNPFCPF